MVTGSFHRVNLNITSYAFITDKTNPFIYTSAALSLNLPAGFVFRQQAIYEFTNHKVTSITVSLEKHVLKHAFMNASYQQNFYNNLGYYQVGLRYDFSFAHVSFSAGHSKNLTTFSQSASGSIVSEAKANYFNCTENSNVGKGGIILMPFLDINGNGKRDNNEPKVGGLNVQIIEGGIKKNRADSTILFSGMEPYRNYLVELDGNEFENIAWKIAKPTLSIEITPNQLRRIEIPITIMGEVSGTVYQDEKNNPVALPDIKIDFYNSDSILVASTFSEPDGFFSFLGLTPGTYIARIDNGQLNSLQVASLPESLSFTIQRNQEGDSVDDLKFVVEERRLITQN